MTVRRCAAVLSLMAAILALPAAALAHADLVASDPADGSALAAPPSEVTLTFGAELDPDGSAFTVIGPSGDRDGTGEVDLDVAERNVMRGGLDASADGAYEVRWTALSIDGHTEEGVVRFSVRAGPAPDTALPSQGRAGPLPAWPIGAVLLVASAAALLLRRRAIVLLVVPAILAACVSDTRPAACDADRVTIDVALTATELTPNDPSVCRDQDVTLVVDSSTDGVLHLHGYDEAVPATTVRSGETVTLEFTASRSGQFPIELHPGDDPEGVAVGIFTVHEP